MDYSIDSKYLKSDFDSISSTQQCIILEWLGRIYNVENHWKEEVLSFPPLCHSSKPNTLIKFLRVEVILSNFKGQATPCVQKYVCWIQYYL